MPGLLSAQPPAPAPGRSRKPADREPHRPVVAAHRCGLAGRSPPTSPCSSIAASTTPAWSWRSSLPTAGGCSCFPGDAQVGNWLSWQESNGRWMQATVEASRPDGAHRLSQGRPSRQPERDAGKAGLDLMTSADLSAFIPTNQKDAQEGRLGRDALRRHPDRASRQDERPRHPRRRRVDRETRTASRLRQAVRIDPGGAQRARDKARGKGGLWVEVDLA